MFIVDVLSFSSCHVILCCSREFVPKTIIISPVSYHDDPWMNVIHFILLIYNLSICYLNGMKQPTCFWPKKNSYSSLTHTIFTWILSIHWFNIIKSLFPQDIIVESHFIKWMSFCHQHHNIDILTLHWIKSKSLLFICQTFFHMNYENMKEVLLLIIFWFAWN